MKSGMRRVRLAWLVALALVSCRDERPRDIAASSFAESGIAVKSRRASVMNGKVAWAGLVLDESERPVRSAFVEIVVRGKGGAEIGRARSEKLELLPRYGVLVEVNGIAVSAAPETVEPRLVDLQLAPAEEPPPKWKPAAIAWEKPLPDGISFAVEEDARCGTTLGGRGEPGTFACTLGLRHTGTRPATALALRFKPARGGDALDVRPPHPTDLPIEPGDALVFRVAGTVKKPSEMILSGIVSPGR